MLKRISAYLILIIIFSSCKVYRPYEVDYTSFDGVEKEYYLRFDETPHLIYKLESVESSELSIKGFLNTNIVDVDEEITVELWMVEGYQHNLSNGKEVTILPKDIKRVEEFKYSTKASILQNTGIVFGAALVGAIIYVSSNQ